MNRRFVKGTFARTFDGDAVEVEHQDAIGFCLIGGVEKSPADDSYKQEALSAVSDVLFNRELYKVADECGIEDFDSAEFETLESELREDWGISGISNFNDAPETTIEDINTVIDEANSLWW